MKDVLISLASGLVGVIIVVIIQICHNKKMERHRLLNSYKVICLNEWLELKKELQTLMDKPQKYNYIIFQQSINQKKALLNFIVATDKSCSKKINILRDKINDKNWEISADNYNDNYAAEALNIGKVVNNKKKLIREYLALVNEVVEELSNL